MQITEDNKKFIEELLLNGGPEKCDYERLTSIINNLESEEEINAFRELIHCTLGEETLQGFANSKPFGYSGDFMMIEKIFHNWIDPNPEYHNWDNYFQAHSAPTAVRRRKEHFVKLCENQVLKYNNAEKRVLVLGSGPATDVYEFLTKNPQSNLKFDLVDGDAKAVEYAKSKKEYQKFENNLNFINRNALRIDLTDKYSFIWSAGMFDYLKDKHFTYTLKKYYNCLEPDGEMIIGNFAKNNPSQKYMEIVGRWYLLYRSEEELINLSLEAEIDRSKREIDKETLGVNLLLKVRR